MHQRVLGVFLSLLLLITAAAGLALGTGSLEGPPDQGTLILTVEVDHAGVRALLATRKPKLEWRSPAGAAELPFGWRLLGADGQLLAEGRFDAHELCLEPSHAGEPPHIQGDECIPHLAHQNVKIPALAAAKTLEISRRAHGGDVPFGTITLDSVPVR